MRKKYCTHFERSRADDFEEIVVYNGKKVIKKLYATDLIEDWLKRNNFVCKTTHLEEVSGKRGKKELELVKVLYTYSDGSQRAYEGRNLKKYGEFMDRIAPLVLTHKKSWKLPDSPAPRLVKEEKIRFTKKELEILHRLVAGRLTEVSKKGSTKYHQPTMKKHIKEKELLDLACRLKKAAHEKKKIYAR